MVVHPDLPVLVVGLVEALELPAVAHGAVGEHGVAVVELDARVADVEGVVDELVVKVDAVAGLPDLEKGARRSGLVVVGMS